MFWLECLQGAITKPKSQCLRAGAVLGEQYSRGAIGSSFSCTLTWIREPQNVWPQKEAIPAARAAVSSAASVARAADVACDAEPASAASEAAVEGMRPAGLLWLPMWMTPRKKVPVVMTNLLHRILSPAHADIDQHCAERAHCPPQHC